MAKSGKSELLKKLQKFLGVSALEEFEDLTNEVVELFVDSTPEAKEWLLEETTRVFNEGFENGTVSNDKVYTLEAQRFELVESLSDGTRLLQEFFDQVFKAGESNRVRNSLLSIEPLPRSLSFENFATAG